MFELFTLLGILLPLAMGLVEVTTSYYQAQSLNALTPAMAELHGAKVGLLAAPFTPTPSTTYAQVTATGMVPTYAGYAEIAVAAWTAAFTRADGKIAIDGGDVLFQPGTTYGPDTIYGWYLADSMDAHVFKVVIFDAPIGLAAFPDAILVDVDVAYGD